MVGFLVVMPGTGLGNTVLATTTAINMILVD
jgi:hypothetical protein